MKTMTKAERSKYFMTKYFQKSRNFLLPLISREAQEGLLNSYLFAEGLEENISEYFLICEIRKGCELNEDLARCLYSTYENEVGNDICLFDLSSVKADVDKFLDGRYSQYSVESKHKILRYFKWGKKVPSGAVMTVKEVKQLKNDKELHFYVFLYPESFKEEVAEEMYSIYNIFSSYNEALQVLKEMKELCSPYDADKETLTKIII